MHRYKFIPKIFQRSMEGLLAYDSCSSSEESYESPKKKPKVTESDNIIIYAGSNRNTENGKLESPLKPGEQCRLFSNNLTESKHIANTSNSSVSTQNDFCGLLIDDNHKTSARGYFRTSTEKNAKSPALFNSGSQKTMSSLFSSGLNVKPYVSKRQREKLVQATSLSLMANQPLQDIDLTLRNGSLKGANYHPDKAEFTNRKETDQVCRPSKKLHLNLKGHTQGVNCISGMLQRVIIICCCLHLWIIKFVFGTHEKVELVRKVSHVILN